MKWFSIIVLLSIFAFAGCEGPEGPMGPRGLEGPPGPGSRIIYESTGTVPDSPNPICYSVPEIDLDNMPSVSVYLSEDRYEWVEIPTYFDIPDYVAVAILSDGEVCLLNCAGWYFMIVIIM
jgi:hypothetical protein